MFYKSSSVLPVLLVCRPHTGYQGSRCANNGITEGGFSLSLISVLLLV